MKTSELQFIQQQSNSVEDVYSHSLCVHMTLWYSMKLLNYFIFFQTNRNMKQ